MNERGFFSIVGMCLLLVITLSIMAIQGTEKNYSYLASDFQEEFELQSVAERGLIEAAEKIRSGEIIVNPPNDVEYVQNRKYWQRKISVSQPASSDRFKNISVEVYGENGNIHSEIGETVSADIEIYLDGGTNKNGIVLISVASGENKAGVKKFRRSLAYILEKETIDGEKKEYHEQIYFMDTLSNGE